MIEKFAHLVVKYRWLVIVSSLLLIIASVYPLTTLKFDNSNEMWFVEDDPALLQYERFKDKFGDSQYLILGFEAAPGQETVITKDSLLAIHKLTEFLQDHEHITKVTSLTNYQYIHADEDSLIVDPLIDDIEEMEWSSEELGRIIDIMKGENLAHGNVITEDLKHTLISARAVYQKNGVDKHIKLVEDMRQFLAEEVTERDDFILHISGLPFVSERMQHYARGDQNLLYPSMIVLILFFLILSFRSFSGVFMPLVVIIGSSVLAMGFTGLMGWNLNILNTILPILLVTVGIGDSVHILIDFYQARKKGFPPKEAAVETIKDLFNPCLNTSLTTSFGFLALSISSLVPVREFGLAATVGVLVAMIFSLTTLPALLSFQKGSEKNANRIFESGFIAQGLKRLAPINYKYRKLFFFLGLILLGLSIWSASFIQADANFTNYFKKETPLRQDIEYLDKVYEGGNGVEFVLDSGVEGGVFEPDFLQKALRFQDYLISHELTGKPTSMLDYLLKMNQSMHADDPAFYVLPDSRELAAQYMFLYRNSSPEEDLTDLISFEEQYIRIRVRLENLPTSRMRALVEEFRQEITKNYPDFEVEITGESILFNNMDIYIQDGLIKSFSLALVIIVICLFILLRSFKYGLMALISSLFPILFAGGIMGFWGIYLDFATMIVAAVTFGIAVDDAIHITTRYIRARREGEGKLDAVQRALMESGRAVIFTSLILYFGFSILLASSFVPNMYFGLLGGIIILLALISVLFLMPSVMLLTGVKSNQKKKS